MTRTGTPTGTRTFSATRSATPTPTATALDSATPTGTVTRTVTTTRSATPAVTATVTASGTVTPLAGFVSVDLVADARGDNGDGSFTTLVAALLTDRHGNPVGDGAVVTFLLAPAEAGVTIAASGSTDALPDCDVRSYVAATGKPVSLGPGTALSCLRYVRSLEGEDVTVAAQVMGVGGLVQAQRLIRLPTGATPTPAATDTPTVTGTATASGTVTKTGTVTPTSADTVTPTVTPTPTPTETPLAPIRVSVVAGAARPGTAADIRFDLADELGQVYGLSVDLLIDVSVFDIFQITTQCRIDPMLTTHQLSVTLAFDPVVPAGERRFRFVLFDAPGTADQIRPGPIVECALPVSASAPVGPSSLTLDRVLAGDQNGNLLDGVLAVNGVLSVDPDAPLPTATASPSNTPTATPSASATATRTATVTATDTATSTATPVPTHTASPTDTPTALPSPTGTATPTPSVSPTPSPSPVPCAGDCNGDGSVSISEVILAVNISLGTAAPSTCPAADRNRDGAVTIDEVIAAVGNALNGCPR